MKSDSDKYLSNELERLSKFKDWRFSLFGCFIRFVILTISIYFGGSVLSIPFLDDMTEDVLFQIFFIAVFISVISVSLWTFRSSIKQKRYIEISEEVQMRMEKDEWEVARKSQIENIFR